MTELWTTVFAIGGVQGLFLCGALLLRRSSDRTAARLLAALIGVAVTMIAAGAVIGRLPFSASSLLVFLNINTELAIGPLMLLFARSLVEPARGVRARDARHFVPLAAGMMLWGTAWLVLSDADHRLAFLAGGPTVPVYMLLKLGFLIGYAAATFRTLSDQALEARASGRRAAGLAWLRHGVLAIMGLAGAIYAAAFAERLGISLPFESDPFASLVLTVVIYLASWMVLQRPWVLALRPRPAPGLDLPDEVSRLTVYLETERPWLQPDLSLGDLAAALRSKESHLSAVIREGLDTNFYALINRYRLAEFERLARDPAQRHRSVLELVYESGFNSKAAFYRVFRESHGMTPSEFRAAAV